MYTTSIFGWLDLLERRISTIWSSSPVTEAPITKQNTESCRIGLLELVEQLEPLFGSISIEEKQSDAELEVVETVLGMLEDERAVRKDQLSRDDQSVIEDSPRFQITNGYVFVPVNRFEYSPNVPPVMSAVADLIESLLIDIQDIVKFLRADDMNRSASLIEQWKEIGGLLQDLYYSCLKLVQQVDQRRRVTETVEGYNNGSEPPVLVSQRGNND